LGKQKGSLPVLFVIDLKMERTDSGHRLLDRIRRAENLRHIPVVICSTSNRKKDIVTAYKRGANSFVSKEQKKKEMAKQFTKLFSYWDHIAELP
jgi:two-component system response regulator